MLLNNIDSVLRNQNITRYYASSLISSIMQMSGSLKREINKRMCWITSALLIGWIEKRAMCANFAVATLPGARSKLLWCNIRENLPWNHAETTVLPASSYDSKFLFLIYNVCSSQCWKKQWLEKKAIINRQSSSKWHFHVHCERNLPRLFLEFAKTFVRSQKVQINNSNMRDLNLKHHAPLCDGQNLCVSPLLELKKCCHAFKTCGQKTRPTFDDLSNSRPIWAFGVHALQWFILIAIALSSTSKLAQTQLNQQRRQGHRRCACCISHIKLI
jgi:hypothetical protein